jgi:Kef-type K+ transport system membrane component KefB
MHDPILYSVFMVFTGAAVLATFALYARQSLLVVYVVLGVLLGSWGLGLVRDAAVLEQAAHIGIIFLLFLLGLDLKPQGLIASLGQSTVVTAVSSAAFALLGAGVALVFGLSVRDAVLVGAASMFSSTIIGVKLLPTTALHHQHVGQIIIGILLLQDLLAIMVLLMIEGAAQEISPAREAALLLMRLPGLILFAFLFERYVLVRLLRRFDQLQEYLFLVAIGWCLGMAEFSAALGLSAEIGAFVAGVAVATHPIALFIAQSLRPLRDFFLVLFFFSLGAQLDLGVLAGVLFPVLVLTAALTASKPLLFRALLIRAGERATLSEEVGVRLGQLSEFAFLIALKAVESGFASQSAAYVVKGTALLSFIISAHWVGARYPTPIAASDHLRRD